MLLSQTSIGTNLSPIELVMLSTFAFSKNLFKIQFADKQDLQVNLFLTDSEQIEFFQKVPTKAKVVFSEFIVTKDLSSINQHFPQVIIAQNPAFQGSYFDFVLMLPSATPSFAVIFNERRLEYQKGESLASINPLKFFYDNASCLEKNNGAKYLELESISHKVKNCHFLASCCAVIIDCCDSYSPKPGENPDFLVSYKITDPSYFPRFVNVNVFHKDPREIPKIANFGDIIILNEIQFQEYNNNLQGLIPANSKNMSFSIVKYNDQKCVPYASYKTNFQPLNLAEIIIKSLIQWEITTFTHTLPSFFDQSEKTSEKIIPDAEEVDVLTKILEFCRLGIKDEDPLVCVLQGPDENYQLIIPHDRKRLLKYANIGDSLRIRSLSLQNRIFRINKYTEILVLPPEFKNLQVPDRDSSSEVKKIIDYYVFPSNTKIVTQFNSRYTKYPLVKFEKIKEFPAENVIRLEGYALKVTFKDAIRISLWNGEAEDAIVEVFVDRNDILSFANGKNWNELKNDIVGYEKFLQIVVKVEEHQLLRVVHTQLIN